MCGITGILLSTNPDQPNDSRWLPELLKKSISQVQHRGYDGAGLAVSRSGDSTIQIYKGYGLINDVLTDEVLQQFSGFSNFGIAHTRYKTVGECSKNASQPLLSDDQRLCLVHNGQIVTNEFLPDSVYLLKLFQKGLTDFSNHDNLTEQIYQQIHYIFENVIGSYSCILMIHNYGLVAFRDPLGIRPLTIGITDTIDFIVSSEDVSIKALEEFQNLAQIRNVEPGEVCIMRKNGDFYPIRININPNPGICIFEYIYLSHPNTVLENLSIKNARIALGELLGNRINNYYSDLNLKYVIPIPESSYVAAKRLAEVIEVMYLPILQLNVNRKQPRSFILPTQELRERAVLDKFYLKEKPDFQGENILLVDDSIVRGTTLKHLIKMIRENSYNLGKIYVASIAPPIRHKNIYGIDIPDTDLLIAFQRNEQEIANLLGADLVIYQDLNEMLDKFSEIVPTMNHFEHSMFIQE